MRFEYALLRKRSKISALIETVLITALGFVMVFLLHRKDIFFLEGSFPWLLIPSLLVALLYGLAFGVLSQALIVAAGFAMHPALLYSYPFGLYAFGSSVLVVLCGQFGSYFQNQIAHIEQLNKYLAERTDHLSRAYYFMKFSHDTIEEQFISRPVSLRSTFLSIQEMLRVSQSEITAVIAQRILEIIAQYCQIQKAQFHLLESDNLSAGPIAHIGGSPNSDVNQDHLVALVRDQRMLTYVPINLYDKEFDSQYLAVAPMVARGEKILGYLLIEQMAFRAINKETFEKLMVLLSYFANVKNAISDAKTILEKYPECPVEFAQEVSQLSFLRSQYNIQSSFVIVKIPRSEKAHFFIENFNEQKRTLDEVWLNSSSEYFYFTILMPLVGIDAVLGYVERVKKWFLETFEIEILKKQIRFHYLSMPKKEPLDVVKMLFDNDISEVGRHESAANISR